MKKMKKILLGFVCITAAISGVQANTKPSLMDIELYLNSLTTFEADFQQYAPGSPPSSGTFYLNKPKQFLWQYKLPHEQKLVSTGSRLFFHDPETEQTTQLPLQSGFAALLTQEHLSLTKEDDFLVHSVAQEADITQIELSLKEDESDARFILKFTNKPLQLLSMSQKGEFGEGVHVLFSNHRQGHTLNKELFYFVPAVEEFQF